jgi:hypothetical protein
MRHKPAIYALLRLHAELGGKVLKARKEAKRLRRDIEQVQAVIQMLEPRLNIRSVAIIKREPNPWFKHGTLFRLAREVTRIARRPLSSREITFALLRQRAVTDASPASRQRPGLLGRTAACVSPGPQRRGHRL